MSMQNTIEAELRAAASSLPEERSAENAQLLLEQLGDGLRASVAIPAALVTWAQQLEDLTLEQVLDLASAALRRLVLPDDDDDEQWISEATLTRDRLESLRVGLRRTCLGSGRVARSLGGFVRLEDELAKLDEALAQRVSRHAAERCLGERRALLGTTSWCDALGEGDDGAGARDDGEVSVEAALSPGGRPSDESVTRYIQGGVGACWIEAFASGDAEFAAELLECTMMLRSVGETVSLAARRWQRRQGEDKTSGAILLQLPLRLSASSEAQDVPVVRRQLGVLYPTEAEAMLEVDSRAATLHVYFEPGSLRSVSFAGTTKEVSPDAEEVALQAVLSATPWRLAVESSNGERFSISLDILGEG